MKAISIGSSGAIGRFRAVRAGVASLLLAGGAVLAPALAQAQSSQWNDIVAAARKEGRVVIYGAAAPDALQRVAAGFKKAHPDIAIEWQRGSSGPLLTKIDQERGAKADGADVFMSTETAWYLARQREGNLLRVAALAYPYQMADIPGAAKVPENVVFWDSDQYPGDVVAKYRDHWSRVFK